MMVQSLMQPAEQPGPTAEQLQCPGLPLPWDQLLLQQPYGEFTPSKILIEIERNLSCHSSQQALSI